jgi:hypothetical protein
MTPSQPLSVGSANQFTVDANGALSGGWGSYSVDRYGNGQFDQLITEQPWLGADETGNGFAYSAGSDPSLGPVWIRIGAHLPASGGIRYGWVSVGDNAAIRPLILNANGFGGFGNVGIGTTNPQHALQVAGTIGAEEVVVSSTGADYVFDPDYKLQPLSEVAVFIRDNHHLPDIPSAEEMKENGASVSEMQSKMLAKIEELTLHMIEAEKRDARLERENAELRRESGEMRDRLASLESNRQ